MAHRVGCDLPNVYILEQLLRDERVAAPVPVDFAFPVFSIRASS